MTRNGVITKVHVMRHGEVHNPEGILYGRLPGYHLSERGKAQAEAVAVSQAVAGYFSAGCQPEYAPLDVIGINEYFGWYAGPSGQIADRSLLRRPSLNC